MLPALSIGIFFENFLIKLSSFWVNPVVPITTLFFNLDAIFRTSKVHLGMVKSIIRSTFLNDFSSFRLTSIPEIFFFLTNLFSVSVFSLIFF